MNKSKIIKRTAALQLLVLTSSCLIAAQPENRLVKLNKVAQLPLFDQARPWLGKVPTTREQAVLFGTGVVAGAAGKNLLSNVVAPFATGVASEAFQLANDHRYVAGGMTASVVGLMAATGYVVKIYASDETKAGLSRFAKGTGYLFAGVGFGFGGRTAIEALCSRFFTSDTEEEVMFAGDMPKSSARVMAENALTAVVNNGSYYGGKLFQAANNNRVYTAGGVGLAASLGANLYQSRVNKNLRAEVVTKENEKIAAVANKKNEKIAAVAAEELKTQAEALRAGGLQARLTTLDTQLAAIKPGIKSEKGFNFSNVQELVKILEASEVARKTVTDEAIKNAEELAKITQQVAELSKAAKEAQQKEREARQALEGAEAARVAEIEPLQNKIREKEALVDQLNNEMRTATEQHVVALTRKDQELTTARQEAQRGLDALTQAKNQKIQEHETTIAQLKAEHIAALETANKATTAVAQQLETQKELVTANNQTLELQRAKIATFAELADALKTLVGEKDVEGIKAALTEQQLNNIKNLLAKIQPAADPA